MHEDARGAFAQTHHKASHGGAAAGMARKSMAMNFSRSIEDTPSSATALRRCRIQRDGGDGIGEDRDGRPGSAGWARMGRRDGGSRDSRPGSRVAAAISSMKLHVV